MRQYYCSVSLGDNVQHIVTNKLVTIPEIAILKRIHGESAVTSIRPATGDMKLARNEFEDLRTDADERERLKKVYDNATPDAEPLVDRLFGPMGALPTTLTAIGVDPKVAAEEMRRRAAELEAAAAVMSDDDEDTPAAVDEDEFFDEAPVVGKKAA
jgi:hypothetical protein